MLEPEEARKMSMQLPKLLAPSALLEAINTASVGIRLLDCAFVPRPRPAYYKYGHFDPDQNSEFHKAFRSDHILDSVHFDLALATHPTAYEKFAHYPAEVFEQYAQLLGLNNNHHLVLYGRGPFGGMLFASRVYWLFKSYGHEGGISLLDGGLAAWKAHQFPVVSEMNEHEAVFVMKKGNWRAMTEPSSKTVTFEELVGEGERKTVDISRWKLLDARPKIQFEGKEYAFDLSKPKPAGSHLAGAINIPSTELVDAETGQFRSPAKLRELVEKSGLIIGNQPEKDGKKLVALCNSGMQASMLATVLDMQFGPQIGDKNLRVYTGSMLEVQARMPELISEK